MTVLKLDRERRVLYNGVGQTFDVSSREWHEEPKAADTPGHSPGHSEVTPAQAVQWLQEESGCPFRVPIGVIGGRQAEPEQWSVAEAVGAGLARLGLTLICGGRGGVMEAACRGAQGAGGLSIGLLPDGDWNLANAHVSVPLATGIGVARNAIIARASFALIAVGGGHGTLSEIAYGLQFGRPVFGLQGAPAVEGLVRAADWQEVESALCGLILRI